MVINLPRSAILPSIDHKLGSLKNPVGHVVGCILDALQGVSSIVILLVCVCPFQALCPSGLNKLRVDVCKNSCCNPGAFKSGWHFLRALSPGVLSLCGLSPPATPCKPAVNPSAPPERTASGAPEDPRDGEGAEIVQAVRSARRRIEFLAAADEGVVEAPALAPEG